MMIRVWEYDVAEDSVGDFEREYGADGAWARLFASSSGFEGTDLFVSLSRPGRYLTVDRFTTRLHGIGSRRSTGTPTSGSTPRPRD